MSPHWLAQCHAKWLRRCTAFQNTSGIKPRLPDAVLLTLTTKPLVRINYSKKTIYELWVELSNFTMSCRISPPATYFFCIQDCSSQIVQVEYQGQTRNTRILERKPLIDTSYCIRHRLEIFSLRTIFAQCSSSSSSTSKKWELITWNLGQIFEIELWMVGQ